MKRFVVFFFSLFLILFQVNAQDFQVILTKGDSCFNTRELHQAASYYRQALETKPERLMTKESEVIVLSKLGDTYFELADYQQSLQYFFKFLDKDCVKNKDSLKSVTYNRIGRCYGNLKQNEQALKFYEKTKETAGDDPRAQGRAYNNIADVYLQMEKYKEAAKYFEKAQVFFKQANYPIGTIVTDINLGVLAQKENKIEFAEQLLKKAVSLAIEINDTAYIVITQIYLAEYYIKISDYDNAEIQLQWTLENAIKNNMPQYITDSYRDFVELYEAKKDYKKAFEYSKLFKTSSDSIFNINLNRDYADLEAKYSIQEKETENELLKKDQQFSESKVLAQRKYIWMLSGVVILAFLLIILFFYQRIKRNKARKLLEIQNKEIKKSQKQLEDLNFQYEKLIAKYEGDDSSNKPTVELS